MKKALCLAALAAIPASLFFSCNRATIDPPAGGGTVYLDLPAQDYSYYPASGTGELNAQATLGRVLFYDRHLSLNNTISCGSCHKQAYAFSDNTAKSAGFEGRLTGRNTPGIQNLGFSGGGFSSGVRLFWDGRENDIMKITARPISNHVEMGMEDLSAMTAKLAALPYYGALFQHAFGSGEITVEKVSTAVARFIMAIRAEDTRFDRAQQQPAMMNALELEGEQLFTTKYNCATCHNEQIGGYFSGNFMNIGLDAPYTDNGLGVITNNAEDRGKFKVPNLRNVALTAPYMHDGRFKSLDDVLEHYSHGIKADANLDVQLKNPATGAPLRMNINTHEKAAIIAFLGTLTDGEMLTNPYYADPFKLK